jgi:hypothetical protein
MMKGKGLAELMLDAGLATDSTISGILSGKKYAASMRAHKAAAESIKRDQFAIFVIEKANVGRSGDDVVDTQEQAVKLLLTNTDMDAVKAHAANLRKLADNRAAFTSHKCKQLLSEFNTWLASIANDKTRKGITSSVWTEYVLSIDRILALLVGVKSKSLPAYICGMEECLPIFWAWDSHL